METSRRELTPRARRLLRLESGAGLCVGVAVITLTPWLATLYGVPEPWVRTMGVANVVYGVGSGSLAWRDVRGRAVSRSTVSALAGANLAWAAVCVVSAVVFGQEASHLGVAMLLVEGAFVGALGVAEWRWARPAG